MGADRGFSIRKTEFNLEHGGDGDDDYAELGNPSIESGTPSNIIDGDFNTYIRFKNYSNSRRYVYEHFYLTPVIRNGNIENLNVHVSTFRLKINSNHDLSVSYKTWDGSEQIISQSSNIDTIFNIYAQIHKIIITAKKDYDHSSFDSPLFVNFYEASVNIYQPSSIQGYDGESIITFADSVQNNSKLQYAKGSTTFKSLLLVDLDSPIASKFRIMTEEGEKAIAKIN